MEENETKICPFCGKELLIKAKKCKFCGSWLNEQQAECVQTRIKYKTHGFY